MEPARLELGDGHVIQQHLVRGRVGVGVRVRVRVGVRGRVRVGVRVRVRVRRRPAAPGRLAARRSARAG